MSRHCTSGRPASIITENWRVNTARFLAGDLLAGLAGFFGCCLASAFALAGVISRDEDLLAPQRGHGRVHRVGDALAADGLARRAFVPNMQKSP